MSIASFAPLIGPILRGAGAVVGAAARSPAVRSVGLGALGAGAVSVIFDDKGMATCPSGFHLRKHDPPGEGPVCVRNRRMNFGNARAARRSVRRIKGARKLLKDIEKLMPKRTVRAARHSVTHT